MIGRRWDSMSSHWGGFTLVEVLLTLCLLVIITSLAWPVLDKPMATLRLQKAADAIHAEWYEARVEAMDSGRTYMFRYTVGGNQFRAECYTPTETADDPVSDDYYDGSSGGLGYTGAPRKPVDGTLPKGVTFLAGQTEADTRAAMIQPAADSSYVGEVDWSEPILFYADGTTSTAVLQLGNEHNRCIELSLRGLTGTVNIGEVSAGSEATP